MATTGDIKNNLRKLQSELKSVKYEKDIDLQSLSKGLVASFLPIYHYIFCDYSRYVAEKIAELNIELLGKSDLRFVESMYKILREIFNYKPTITKDQFFSSSFAERKVIMCAEIIQQVKQLHKSVAVKTVKGSAKSKINMSSASASPSSSSLLAAKPMSAPAASEPTKPAKKNANEASKVSNSTGTFTAKVVNEVRNPSKPDDMQSSMPSSKPVFESDLPSRRLPNSLEDGIKSSGTYNPRAYAGDPATFPVEVVNMKQPETIVNQPKSEEAMFQRPIDTVPVTPARPLLESSRTGTGEASHGLKLEQTLTSISVNITQLIAKISRMEQRLSDVENLVADVNQTNNEKPADEPKDQKQQEQLNQQIENLVARLTLVENRLMMVENKSSSFANSHHLNAPRNSSNVITAMKSPNLSEIKADFNSSDERNGTKISRSASGHDFAASIEQHRGDGELHSINGTSWHRMSSTNGNMEAESFDKVCKSSSSISSVLSPIPDPDMSSAAETPLSFYPNSDQVKDVQSIEKISKPLSSLCSAGTTSSTPTDPAMNSARLLQSHFHEPAETGKMCQNQILRISSMIQETEQMMNLQVDSPVRLPHKS